MHIVLTVLGAIVTILYILDRFDIDVGGLNPWSWRRRRAWARRYQGDPIYSVEDPVEVAALLIVGAARLEGDPPAEQKQKALELFASEFSSSPREATELYASAAHLLGARQVLDSQLDGLLDRNRDRFTKEQAESLIGIAEQVVAAGGGPTGQQKRFLEALRERLLPSVERQGTWA